MGQSPRAIEVFLNQHCSDCHTGNEPEAGFAIDRLSSIQPVSDAVLSAAQLTAWERVLNKVSAGEMPPADSTQPGEKQSAQFVRSLQSKLVQLDRARQITEGRAVIRRLNRVEFENTLSDLLSIPLHIRELLPPDAQRHGFDTVGEALNVSAVQVEAYLDAIDVALDEATKLIPRPQRQRHRLSYLQTTGMMMEYRKSGPFLPVDDGVAMFAPDFFSHFNSLLDTYVVPHSARYRVKVSAYAIRNEQPITLTVRMGGPGHKESDEVRKQLLGNVSVQSGEPQVFEFDEYLQRGQMFRIYPSSLRRMRFAGKQWQLKQDEYTGPAVVIQWVEVDGPIFESWPPPSHQRLYSGVKTVPIADAPVNEDPNQHLNQPPSQIAKPRLTLLKKPNKSTGNRFVYDPKQGIGGEKIYRRTRIKNPLHPTLRFAPEQPKVDAARLLTSFADRAFRGRLKPARLESVIALVNHWLDEGADFEQAMRLGYKTLLVSTDFLYHQADSPQSKSIELTDHQLAERLAYLLWCSLPDQELRDLANAGRLSEPSALRAQVDRMLADSRSTRFISNFLGQWLDLREIDFTSPDSDLYPEFDQLLQWSMIQESERFFQHLIAADRSVVNLVDSDFVLINDRLAKHYGIDGVQGAHFRKVDLPADSVRGGVLTQASVLKVTANGTTTSPVVRGVWVLERIMGTPSNPPPPGVPAIEPDIRGATTVRDQLEKHRKVASCAVCHKKIDPPGVALENFDVIGGYRDKYRALNRDDTGKKASFTPAGPRPILYVDGLPVDAADQLVDGRTFTDVREFKKMLANDPDKIARTLAEKLIVYSTGASVSLADQESLDQIVQQSRKSNHGLRSLIHHIIQSRIFNER